MDAYKRSSTSRSNVKPPPFPSSTRQSLPASLQATRLVAPVKSILPAEIIASIIDHLPIPALMRVARVSKQLKEMVYDDTRWVNKLVAMGAWNETEARQRFEDAMKRKRAAQLAAVEEAERKKAAASGRPPKGIPAMKTTAPNSTIFDAAEESRIRTPVKDSRALDGGLPRGVQNLSINASTEQGAIPPPPEKPAPRSNLPLEILSTVRSVRGYARQEYGRIYAALGPLYFDLARARSHSDPIIFRMFRNPEDQARILSQLKIFEKSDTSYGWSERANRLDAMCNIFENAALREFEGGYEAGDEEGQMKRYAHVMILLNGGQACIQLFVQKHYLMFERERLGNPMDCFSNVNAGSLSLEPAQEFFSKLGVAINEQSTTIDKVFPPTVNVLSPFLERVAEDVIGEYVTPLLDEAHDRSQESYLKAIAAIYFEIITFSRTIKPTAGSKDSFADDVQNMVAKVFEPHVDLYLTEEIEYFKKRCEEEVVNWEKKITDEYAATETFYMSNVNRQADKQDFLSSFKKVILAPVNAVNAIPIQHAFSSFSTHKPAPPVIPNIQYGFTPYKTSRPSSPAPEAEPEPDPHPELVQNPFAESLNVPDEPKSGTTTPGRATPAPTSELEAKAAILNSRMEGIRSLFSIELALSLVQKAKQSLERAALFAVFNGQTGEEAKEQCEAIFIALLQNLGQRHVKSGFDKAVEHLSQYNPREVQGSTTDKGQVVVQPLVQFLELVNVGDLIQQMADVFYEQELVHTKLTDRNDFLNLAVKEKKRFEAMLDERVAAGLNTGIDVLMNEVDYVFAKTQKATDYNPGMLDEHATPEIGPSEAAITIVKLVSTHTQLLVGSTDKNVLDVFNQEVGMRLFASLCKHIKRQRISIEGAIMLISDLNHYHSFIIKFRNKLILQYFNGLRELAQIYLIDPQHAKQMASVIADTTRFKGIFTVEEVYEFVTRRSDWYQVKKDVEGAMYGYGCIVM